MTKARILSFIGWLVISLWTRTVRTTFINKDVLRRLQEKGENFILAFWHGRQFLLFHHHRNIDIVVPASESRDGEIQAGILRHFGCEVVRGSSKRKGERALLGLVGGLRKGKCLALAVDGPRGPIHEVKDGVLYLSGKLNKPIVPLSSGARRHWILEKIWDRYLLPFPFTRGVIVYGEPIRVAGTDAGELAAKREELTAALNAVMAQADAYCNR